jgi:hypothetical protein
MKFNKFFYLACMFMATSLIVSCSDDDSDDNNDVNSAAQFVGTFGMAEDCGGATDAYDIVITETSSNSITISNFYNFDDVTATVDGDDLTIASQVVDGTTYSGSGSIDGDILTLNFMVDMALSCTATGSRN